MNRLTRNQDIQSLTALAAKTTVVLPFSYESLYVKVEGTDPIRININGQVTISATVGLFVDDYLWITDHVIHSLEIIRDTTATADAAVSIMGLAYKE